MSFVFWDSIYNTEICQMTPEQYAEKKLKRRFSDLSILERKRVKQSLKQLQKDAVPNEYSILACLENMMLGLLKSFVQNLITMRIVS